MPVNICTTLWPSFSKTLNTYLPACRRSCHLLTIILSKYSPYCFTIWVSWLIIITRIYIDVTHIFPKVIFATICCCCLKLKETIPHLDSDDSGVYCGIVLPPYVFNCSLCQIVLMARNLYFYLPLNLQ